MRQLLTLTWAVTFVAALMTASSPAWACSDTTDCTVPTGTYRILDTPGATTTLIYAHGYKGKAAGVMKSRLRAYAQEKGLTLVALQSAGDDWAIPNVPTGGNYIPRDEIAYLTSVIEDVETRLGQTRADMVFVGFSAGGMFVSHIACTTDLRLHAFVAIAGTVWAPGPQRCTANPTPFIHLHGTNDKVVPMQGRPIGETRQGDVMTFLTTLAQSRGPQEITLPDGPDVCDAPNRIAGSNVVLCLSEAGHGYQLDALSKLLPQ